MPTNLPAPPHNEPVIDLSSGRFTQPWSDYFQKLFLRTGGFKASSNDELFTVTSDRIAAAVAGNGLTGGAGSALAVNPDGSTLEINTDQVRIKDLGVSTAKLANDAVSFVKQLSTDWTKVSTASGYQKLPSGIYIQWGVTGAIATGTNTSQTFPITFPTACRQVIAGIQGNTAGAAAATGHFGTANYTTSGFDMCNRTSTTYTFNYLAVGI